LYGAFELYDSVGHQLDTYGYAAYALTVVPYILMSLVNQLAALCQPLYPSKFIVTYEGEQKVRRSNSEGQKDSVHVQEQNWESDAYIRPADAKIAVTVGIAYGKPKDRHRYWKDLRLALKLPLKVSNFSSPL